MARLPVVGLRAAGCIERSERLAKTRYHNLVLFNNTHAKGGHFASLEQPEALLSDIRQWLSILRQQELL